MGTQGETCDSPDEILARVVSDSLSAAFQPMLLVITAL